MVCTEIVVQGITCDSIPVNSWKVAKTNPASGEGVPYVIRGDPNTGYEIGIYGTSTILAEGVTDAIGCGSGEIPAQADGTYLIAPCFKSIPGICVKFGQTSITWGVKPIDIGLVVLIGAGILGIAYVLGGRK